ncbi:MAG: polysaccharide deacetylase family protein [Candidatus Saccharimonadales bacterium]
MKKVGKSKSKPRAKVQAKRNKKTSSLLAVKKNIVNKTVPKKLPVKLLQTQPKIILKRHHRIIWAVVILVLLAACLAWPISQSWIVRSYFSGAVTYPDASVFSMNVGDLDSGQLTDKLVGLKSSFEAKKVTLVNDKKQWAFEASKLGVTFDAGVTSQAIWRFNNLDIVDKYKLITGGMNSEVEPTIVVDSKICVKALSVIPATQTKPKDASVYFDKSVKIQSDQPGTKFNAALTCQDITKTLVTNSFVTNVSLDVFQANIKKSDLEPKLPMIQSMVGKSLTLSSGAYSKTLTSKQLLAMVSISKKGSEVKVDWVSSKVDDLVNDIANNVNSYDSAPSLGGCQYVISSGGNWLDKETTKKYIKSLRDSSSRNYSLPVVHHGASIGTIKPVSNRGSSGTIYLTFDDGMNYADQIMNYAACYGVKVTFFEIGSIASSQAASLQRAVSEGHAVQSHGYEHAAYDYGDHSYDWQYNDIKQSIKAIENVTGVRPTYFRPPGGNRSDDTYKAAVANKVNLILWGDSSRDATVGGLSSSAVCSNVLAGAYPGASVLMHSTHYSTAMAFPCIVEGLAARGYNMQALR